TLASADADEKRNDAVRRCRTAPHAVCKIVSPTTPVGMVRHFARRRIADRVALDARLTCGSLRLDSAGPALSSAMNRNPHSTTIRAHLSMLAICAVLPLLAFAVLVSVTLVDHERRTFERGVIERSRALMTAIDAQVRGSLATLSALSASRALAADDLRGFHES